MLVIRPQQIKAFEEATRRRFEDEMMAHSKSFSPRLCEAIGDEQLLLVIRSAMARAEGYGFINRGPMQLFIELTLLCGSSFDTDPQYAKIVEPIKDDADEMSRAERIHLKHNEYCDEVEGPDGANTVSAWSKLLEALRNPVDYPPEEVKTGLLRQLKRIFPEKAVYVGDAALTSLIQKGLGEGQRCGFTAIGEGGLMVFLMFAFGHGCTTDPLYPWIAATLGDDQIVNPAARSKQLKEQAETWLSQDLDETQEGT